MNQKPKSFSTPDSPISQQHGTAAVVVLPDGICAGVYIGFRDGGPEAEPYDPGGCPFRQFQGGNDMAGLPLMAGGPGGDTDALTAQIIDNILTGPARKRDGEDMGRRAVSHKVQVRDGRKFFYRIGFQFTKMPLVLQPAVLFWLPRISTNMTKYFE